MRWIESLILAFIVFTVAGCGVPVPSFSHKVVTGQRIDAKDLSFAVPGETPLEEFSRKWGEPWAYYQDLRVAVYYWETLQGQWLWRVFSPEAEYPGGVVPITRLHYLFLAFDREGGFHQWTIIDHAKNIPVHDLAAQWLKNAGRTPNER